MNIDGEAARFVSEMAAIGATFEVTRSGPNGEFRWFYSARAGMRESLRRHKSSFDLTGPGFEEAIIRAILRLKFAGAP